MSATHAIVLARGLGTRMRAAGADQGLSEEQRRAADAGLKAMMPIAGRPFLDFVLSAIADAGLHRVAVIVAPDHGAARAHYTRPGILSRVQLEFIVQHEARGTADAVLAAQAWIGEAGFLVMNGDNLYPAGVLRELAALGEPGLPGFEAADLIRSSNIAPERIAAFALVETDATGHLSRIVEKPTPEQAARHGTRTLVSMNCWRFDARIFDACREVPRSARGEFELPEAVGLAAARGVRFRVLPARGPVLDLSQRADAAELTRRLAPVSPRP